MEQAHLQQISAHFLADSRPVGGSLFRIYRDTRFGKDKTPYKTSTGIQFRHARGRDVHAPGFDLHLEPGSVFAGAGIWWPDSPTLGRIRDAIAGEPERWAEAVQESRRGERFRLEGESLKRPPAGYDPEHLPIEDLKRKDFIAVAKLSEKTVVSAGFAEELAEGIRLVRALDAVPLRDNRSAVLGASDELASDGVLPLESIIRARGAMAGPFVSFDLPARDEARALAFPTWRP